MPPSDGHLNLVGATTVRIGQLMDESFMEHGPAWDTLGYADERYALGRSFFSRIVRWPESGQ
jgi:hypothetical protein